MLIKTNQMEPNWTLSMYRLSPGVPHPADRHACNIRGDKIHVLLSAQLSIPEPPQSTGLDILYENYVFVDVGFLIMDKHTNLPIALM